MQKKRGILWILLAVMLFCGHGLDVKAEGAAGDGGSSALSFYYELTVDGKDTKEVRPGDIITVVLRLKRTDTEEAYDMYAMQDEIGYDGSFLELVDGSVMTMEGIVTTDLGVQDGSRELYMNHLSMSGGETWEADTLIGSAQFLVTGESGVTKLESRDYLVSLQDGNGSYACEANEVTLIISTECTVTFQTNGGSSIPEQKVQYGEKIIKPDDPEREGYRFEGWYKDIHLQEAWDFEEDVVEENMSLYAKWSEESSKTEVTEDTEEPENMGPADGTDQGMLQWWWLLFVLIMILLAGKIFVKARSSS